MGVWGFVVNVLGLVGVALLLIALGWAAIERGRIHDRVRQSRRRIHVAIAMVLGWV